MLSTPRRKQIFILLLFILFCVFTTTVMFSGIVPSSKNFPSKQGGEPFQTGEVKKTPTETKQKVLENDQERYRQEEREHEQRLQEERELEQRLQEEHEQRIKDGKYEPPAAKIPEPLKDAPLTIGVVASHQNSFPFFKNAIRQNKIPRDGRGLELLHIDSHSGGFISHEINFKIPKITERNSIAAINEVFQHLDHDNFIPIGQYIGMFNTKVNWVRSSWPFQKYELPLGEHKIQLGSRRTAHEDLPFLCYKPFSKDEKSINRFIFEDSKCPRNNKNTKLINWNVFSLDEGIVSNKLNKSSQMIVDIDLDFFSTKDKVIDKLFNKREIIQKYFDLLESYFVGDKICLKDKLKDTIQINQLLNDLMLKVSFLDDNFFQKRNETLKLWCQGEEFAKKQIIEISRVLDYFYKIGKSESISVLVFEHNFPSINCKIDNYFGICETGNEPYHDSSNEEIRENVKKLSELLRSLEKEPALILISRSLDGFTPRHSSSFIEQNLLEELKSIYPKSSVEYFGVQKAKELPKRYSPTKEILLTLSNKIQNFNLKTLKSTKIQKLKVMKLFLKYVQKKKMTLSELLFDAGNYMKYQTWLNSKLNPK
jgi:hypothetical protein